MHQLLLQLPVCPEEGVEELAPYTDESATRSFQGTLFLKEQVRRMRGGSQSHLMRCKGEDYYVVKFQGNPQGTRILVNEMLGTLLAARMGLPTTPVAVCSVSEDLIRLTPDLCFEIASGRLPCQPGLHFGSRYVHDPRNVKALDFLSAHELSSVKNVMDFAGMLVFDKWTCNTDGRQTLFIRTEEGNEALMIDQGMCFNGGEWSFPDAPLRGLYARYVVYEQVSGLDDFEPWLTKLENINESVLMDTAQTIPSEWYEGDWASLERLLEQLDRRRCMVRELLWETWKSRPYAFPNWNDSQKRPVTLLGASALLCERTKEA
jgi:HipA-like protein